MVRLVPVVPAMALVTVVVVWMGVGLAVVGLVALLAASLALAVSLAQW